MNENERICSGGDSVRALNEALYLLSLAAALLVGIFQF